MLQDQAFKLDSTDERKIVQLHWIMGMALLTGTKSKVLKDLIKVWWGIQCEVDNI